MFRLRRWMVNVMVTSVVALGRQRDREQQHRRDDEHSSWALATHNWKESQNCRYSTTDLLLVNNEKLPLACYFGGSRRLGALTGAFVPARPK
jgi:hypothetical protein